MKTQVLKHFKEKRNFLGDCATSENSKGNAPGRKFDVGNCKAHRKKNIKNHRRDQPLLCRGT
jgi:hypothetical protein